MVIVSDFISFSPNISMQFGPVRVGRRETKYGGGGEDLLLSIYSPSCRRPSFGLSCNFSNPRIRECATSFPRKRSLHSKIEDCVTKPTPK